MRRVLAGNGPPNVLSITRLGANPTNQSSVAYRVLFDEAVQASTVDVTDFVLTRGGSLTGGNVSSVSGTGDTYTVQASTGSGDGTLRLDLIDDNTIRDLSGDRLGGNGPGNGNFTTGELYTLDRTAPSVVSLNRLSTNPSAAASVDYVLTFSEPVTGVDASDFDFVTSGVTGASVSNISGSGASYTITVSTGTGDGSLQLRLQDDDTIRDTATNRLGGVGANNGGLLGQSYTFARAPFVVSVTPLDFTYTNNSSVRFAVQFSQTVFGVDVNDFAPLAFGVVGASVISVSGSAADYIVTLNTGSGDGSLFLNKATAATIVNAAGTSLTAVWPGGAGYSLDRTAPIVQSVALLDPNPTNQSTVRFAVTFSEPVTSVDTNDFALIASGPVGAAILSLTQVNNTVWTITVGTGTDQGLLTVDVLSVNQILDIAGNALAAPVSGNPYYTIDRFAPVLQGIERDAPALTNAATVSYTIGFSEAVTGLTIGAFSVQATGLTGATVQSLTGSGSNYTLTLTTGSGQGTLAFVYDFTVVDQVGYTLHQTGIAPAYNVDRVVPTVVSLQPQLSGPTSNTDIFFSLQFSERVGGVSLDDFQVLTSGAASGVVTALTTGDNTNYTVRITAGLGDGEIRLRLADDDSITDGINLLGGTGAGNGDFSSSSGTLIQNPPDIAAITPQGGNPTAASVAAFTVQFNEPVTGIDVSDFSLVAVGITGAVISGLTGSGANYTLAVTNISGNGTLAIALNDDDTIIDANALPLRGVGSASAVFTSSPLLVIDQAPPLATSLAANNPSTTRAASVGFRLTFSENVSGVDISDFAVVATGSITGAAVSSVSVLGNVYTVTVAAGTGNGSLQLRLADNDSIVDAVGLPLGGVGAGNGDLVSTVGYSLENSGESSISGVLFQDLNNNGIREATEPPLSNWSVYLDTDRNRQVSAGEPTATTAADGSYSISGLFSGQYNVSEVLPAQWEQTSPGAGNFPIQRISVTTTGAEGTAPSDAPSLSADGRFVAFESSSILVPGDTLGNDIFVYDRVTNSLSKASIGLGGALADGNSFAPAISNDGRLVAFYSNATNLVTGDINGLIDVFVYDRQTQTTTLVSRGPGGVSSNGSSDSGLDISGDGRFVTFQSFASNLAANDTNSSYDIFVVDLQNNDLATRTQLVSKSTSGVIGNGASQKPMINDDGSSIVFESSASNLVSGDTNNQSDIFLFNRLTSTTRRISVTGAGTQVSSSSQGAAISGDGNFAGFWSNAFNLVTGDNNGGPDVFLVNLNTNTVEMISRTQVGQAAGGVGRPLLSTTGRYVAFTSSGSLLTNSGVTDVFVRDRFATQQSPQLRRISQTQFGSASGGNGNFFGFSDDGRFAAFGTDAKHLISGDNNYNRDVYMVDLSYQWLANANVVTLGVSQALSGIAFGNRILQGEVTGTSWQDTSRNGFRDGGEPANAGRQIYVDINGNSIWEPGEPITTTDATGAFRLTPVPTGQQRIREILPANWTATSPANSTYFKTIGTRSVLLNFEELSAVTSSTIGVYEREGFVLATTSGSSSQWRIDVPTGSNTKELVSISTGAGQHLMRKDYRPFSVSSLSVRSNTGAPIDFVAEMQDGSSITQSVSTPAGKSTVNLTGFTNLRSLRWSNLVSVYIDNISTQTTDNDYAGLDFGSMSLPGQIRGTLYYDSDQDGQRDASELPVTGRQVYLDADNDGILDPTELSVLSDASGNYGFTPLNAGTYTVRQFLPTNWSQTEPSGGYLINVDANQTVSNVSFGSWGVPGSIQGTKWHDVNADGVRDATEPGLAGWTIYLDLNNNGGLDADEPSTVTATDNPSTSSIDETGSYAFNNLAPLYYTVREVAQPGWQQTSPVAMQSTIQFNVSTGITAPIFQQHPDFDNFVSGSGRYEVFTTTTPLLPQDTNSLMDVYVLDRQLNSYDLISVGLNGVAPSANSLEPTISDDGRYVAFRSFGTTLTTTTVNPAIINVYVRDRVAGTTQLISNGTSGPANDYSYEPVISGDGRTLLFFSWASNLVAGDTDLLPDLFAKDMISGQLTRIEASAVLPSMPIAETWGADVSSDGRFVSFQAVSQGIGHVFWQDRTTNQIRLASTSSAGVPGNSQSEKLSISDDGRYIVFDSSSSNLADELGVNGFNVYMKDTVTGETRLISRNYLGGAANGSRRPEISRDGRWVVFESTSQTMFADSSNSPSQIVLYDRLTNTLTRLTGSSGVKGNSPSVNASISADGRTIAFQSTATNLGVSGRGLFTIDRTLDYATPQTINLSLAAGTTFGRADIGNAQPNATITGAAFEDTNRNGQRDVGETAIANAIVFIDANKNGVRDAGEPSSVSGNDGTYSLSNLLPGSYTVRAGLPGGRVATGPATTRTRLFGVYGTSSTLIAELNPQTGAQMSTLAPTLAATTQVGAAFDGTNVLLLNQGQGAIIKVLPNGSTVRVPISYNYLPGLAYQNGLAYFIATINSWPHLVAFDVNQSQAIRTLPITHSLDGYGPAAFPEFGAGLAEAPDGNGLIITAADVTSNDQRLLRIDTDTGRITQYVTPVSDLGNDFGATGAAGELFVSTASSIRVFDTQFQPLRTLPTPQTYYGMASGTVIDYGQTITVQSGQSVSSVNFGQRTIASSVTGQLYDDRNGNQQTDAGEPALAGVTVYIDNNANFRFDAGEPSTQSDSSGRYTLSNVASGSRTVRVVPSAGMEVNTPANQETRIFGMRVNAGVGAIVELEPITGVVKNQLSSPVGTSISISAGLAFDGSDLYLLEANTNRIYALNPDTGSVRRSLQLSGTGYDGLASIGGKLYVQDSIANAILEIDAGLTGILRTLNINQINPSYLGVGVAIDLSSALGESADGTRLIAQTNNNAASYLINPATGLIEGQWGSQVYIGLTGAGGEVFTSKIDSTFLDVYNSQAEIVRRGSFVTSSIVALAAASINMRGGRVVVLSGHDYQLDVGLRDNSTPTAINFSSTAVAENLSAGSVVANLASTDANPNDVHQYALVSGTGDNDNGLFEIAGGQLRTRQVFDFESRSSFSIRLRTTDATGNSFETVQSISVINLPEVSAVQIGDGSAQRSTVDRVVIDLEGQVDIDAGAFLLQKRERDSQGALVLQTVTSTPTITLLPGGNTRVTLAFSGTYVRVPVSAPVLGALVDGNYQLTIDATKVRAAGMPTQLDGDRNGISGGDYLLGTQAADNFFAMYGDSDGNRNVGVADFGRFRSTFGKAKGDVGYDAAFDYDGNESVGVSDLGQFRSRFGKTLDF